MLKFVGTYDIPEWAIYPLEYGIENTSGLIEEDITDFNEFIANFPNGYITDIKWHDSTEFDCFPSIGHYPCKTFKVDFYTESDN